MPTLLKIYTNFKVLILQLRLLKIESYLVLNVFISIFDGYTMQFSKLYPFILLN